MNGYNNSATCSKLNFCKFGLHSHTELIRVQRFMEHRRAICTMNNGRGQPQEKHHTLYRDSKT